MLLQTHDPIADFINAVSTDIISFAGNCDFETFKSQAKTLNNLETYTELCTGAEITGYTIKKVVYRGYNANAKLQQMHDDAIELRTRLVLETETGEQQQELSDLKLDREHTRALQVREQENRTLQHQLEQQTKDRNQKLTTKQKEEELQIQLNKQRHEAENTHRLELKFSEWNNLHQSGVDLTAVLVAQQRNPDKSIRLDQSGDAELHLHEAI